MSQSPPPQISSPKSHHALPETTNSPNHNGLPPTVPLPPSPINQQNPNELQDTAPRAVPENDEGFFKEMRGWLMIVAILAAGSTYQAGLNPPGNFWQADDSEGHVAGNPILHDKFFNRYQAFFYCNAVSFLSSLVIIIFLMNKNFYRDTKKIKVLEITMVLDLFSFMAAYAAGSCRRVTSSIYVFLIMGGVFVYVISFARHYSVLHSIARQMPCARPCMNTTEQNENHTPFKSEA